MFLVAPALAETAEQGLTLEGSARTGTLSHAVRFLFVCTEARMPGTIGTLAIELWLNDYPSLRPAFDVDPFEGPGATAGVLSALQSSGAKGKGAARFGAAGWITIEKPYTTFALGISAARRGDAQRLKQLTEVLRPLVDGPSELIWTQGNAKKGGTPIVARLTLDAAQAATLKDTLKRCIAG